MSRIYSCPVIGAGTEEDPYRPLVADLIAGEPGDSWSACLSTDEEGKPRLGWCVVEVETADWSQVDRDGRMARVEGQAAAEQLARMHYPETTAERAFPRARLGR